MIEKIVTQRIYKLQQLHINILKPIWYCGSKDLRGHRDGVIYMSCNTDHSQSHLLIWLIVNINMRYKLTLLLFTSGLLSIMVRAMYIRLECIPLHLASETETPISLYSSTTCECKLNWINNNNSVGWADGRGGGQLGVNTSLRAMWVYICIKCIHCPSRAPDLLKKTWKFTEIVDDIISDW